MRVLRDIVPENVTAHANAAGKRVAIIGAGASGLCAAKVMLQHGYTVTVYEIGSNTGGMWCYENDNGLSSAYRTLHINTSKSVTRFSDLPFDDAVQNFPDHVDMHEYLAGYADQFGVTEHIRFNTTVERVEPDFVPGEEKPRWKLTTADAETEVFDTVIAATGHLHVPRHVPMFRDDFQGEYLHAHYYREPDSFVGKRICIVGVGNSACDISGDLCATAKRCVLVARSGVMILPKLMFGRPFTEISSRLQRPWIPAGLRRRLLKTLTWLVHGDMGRLGFKAMDKRVHTTSNGTVVTDIAYSRIEVKQGINKIDGKTVHFVDGSEEEFDVLIGATGYLTDLPYLSPDIVALEDNQMDLYQRMVPPKWPGLYLMGFFNTDTALNFIFEHQAHWIASIENGDAKLPSEAAMMDAVVERRRWVDEYYRATARHNLEEESVPYLQSLQKSLKAMRAA